MKNQITVILFMLAFAIVSTAQQSRSSMEAGEVEKSLYGLQVGLLGISAHSEIRIGATASLRIEAGLSFEGIDFRFNNNDELYVFPVFSVEPRYYYNLDRRLEKGKKINANSGNFISLLVKASTGRTIDFATEERRINEDYGVYARWGLKRTFGKHFTMETAVGPGIVRSYSYDATKLSSDIDVMFRIGYTFLGNIFSS